MNIDIKARGFTLTEVLRGYVQRRLYFTLGRYSDRIERVAFVLEEVAGPSNGLDYKSQIRVEASHLPPFAIEDRGAYLWMAVDRAADRAGRKLGRAIYGEKGPPSFGLDYALAPRFGEWIASRSIR